MSDIEFNIDGRKAFSDVARTLGRINRSIPRDIDKAIEKEAKTLKKEAAAKALTEPAFKGKHTGLRKDIARGVGVAPISEAGREGYRVITAMPDENEAIIPRGFDSRKGWRHPVFGKPIPWVTQRGAFSWFMDTMQHARPRLEPKIHDILEDAADQVERSAHNG